jgi:purine nucleosidase
MKKRRVILDTDPGIDDALAILLALASPEVELEAITVTFGNCSVDQGVQNALSILDLAHSNYIPVAKGADRPLVQPLLLAPETHGNSGLGYAQLPPSKIKPDPTPAVHLLIEKVMAESGEMTVVAIGPLTNLALAIRLEPGIVQAIKEVYIMGGAIRYDGNTTPLAEYNTYCDPHAAHIVYHSGLPVTLVPLDVTYQVVFTSHDLARLRQVDAPLTQFISDATRFYMEFHDEYQQISGCVINDPLALAITYLPELVETQELFVDVDISGGVSMGKTYADFYKLMAKEPNMKVALEVRPREFLEHFLERMEWLVGSLENVF